MESRNSPISGLTEDFIVVADRYELDWRLLPAIATLESGAGERYTNNNIFGWDSCRTEFASIREGINHVASRLANSKLYKDKDLDGILRTYNPYRSYPARIKRIMHVLGPADPEFVANTN